VREIVVFTGSAHRPLARSICDSLGVGLSSVELTRFSNDCLQAQLQANCRQRDVYIVQPLVPPTQEHLMELLLMVDAAKGASAAQITAVIPHYAYARSDKKDASRISLGGRLVADMLVTAGVSRVLTMTLHAPQVHGFFSVPVDHLSALGVLATPGACGVDVCVGEGQTLGNRLDFGGPSFGFFAATEAYLRRMPGRIAGETVDADGRQQRGLATRPRTQIQPATAVVARCMFGELALVVGFERNAVRIHRLQVTRDFGRVDAGVEIGQIPFRQFVRLRRRPGRGLA